MSGYVTSLSSGAASLDSIPVDIRRWRFQFSSSGGTKSARVGLRCLRLKLPAGGLQKVRSKVFTSRIVVQPAAHSSVTARESCAAGYVPTGYGLGRSAAPRALQLASAVPRPRGWTFRVENTGASAQPATLRLRCISARVTGTRSGHTLSQRFSIARKAFSDTVSGNRSLTHRCGGGSLSLAAGHVVPVGDDSVMRLNFASGNRSGRWDVRNPSGAGAKVRTYLTCLSLRTRFR
jgi:hypothetical protein